MLPCSTLACHTPLQLLAVCTDVLSELAAAARSIADRASGGSAPPELQQQAATAAAGLQSHLAALQGQTTATPAVRAEQLQQLLPAAEGVAALASQHQALSEQAQAAQRELAFAAAGRSCAYLRCSTVQAEGGAAAGQCTGSMRCRWGGRERTCACREWRAMFGHALP